MDEQASSDRRPRIVIIGGGFAGLQAARVLTRAPVQVTVLDRNNYHGFWPLLYQVATGGLEAESIAQPVRAVLRRAENTEVRLANVTGIDRRQRRVLTDVGEFPYDQLIVAAGSVSNFFGLDDVRDHALELKDVADALAIRNQIITCFERATATDDEAMVRRMLHFVVVGGGPTGVEMAGAIAELIRHVLRKDFRALHFELVKVTLLEAADRLLLAFPPTLGRRALRQLEGMGIDVRLNAALAGYDGQTLRLKNGSTIATDTVIWAAGIQASPVGAALDVELQRGGRVAVTPQLQLKDDPNVWIVGDLAYLEGPDGKPYPQLATVAMQQGRLAARNVLAALFGRPLQPFRYIDKGTMATVGRRYAVARVWGANWSGPLAWLLWLAVHLYYLVGFRNRVLVLINWAWNYFTYDRGSRALVHAAHAPRLPVEDLAGPVEHEQAIAKA